MPLLLLLPIEHFLASHFITSFVSYFSMSTTSEAASASSSNHELNTELNNTQLKRSI